MRYYLDTTTLFVRGAFRAASTGISGGIRSVTTLFNHTVPADWDHTGPEKRSSWSPPLPVPDRTCWGSLPQSRSLPSACSSMIL